MRKTTHLLKDYSNNHLSIRDSTMTSWKGSYLHTNRAIIKLKKINKWQRKLNYSFLIQQHSMCCKLMYAYYLRRS